MVAQDSLAQVIGRNARAIRLSGGFTLEQVAIATRNRGLRWSESRVADLEAGRVAANIATLVAVSLAFTDLDSRGVTLHDLISHERPIEMNENLIVTSEQLGQLLAGDVVDVQFGPRPYEMDPNFFHVKPEFQAKYDAWSETDKRAAKTLRISKPLLREVAMSLWNTSFATERDRRAGRGANAQQRGRISRQMFDEIREALETGNYDEYDKP
ncbi:helix-turn-helix domain-containing protein [Mycolicibacterium gadium]|uniref:Uncharacterized protein n=1 Tax=Mycolicibacterium gadium TaxID=1794 RepID=A0A7I7WE91_MYCGU|nr:hypothetical protein [Mycolicibacterium gadium]BBZ15866.1 hypothetical protein MGAD_02010 [Mycolicibacterium gadium]